MALNSIFPNKRKTQNHSKFERAFISFEYDGKQKMSTHSFQVGIIGGSGLDDPEILDDRREIYRETPYGTI